MNAWVKRAVLSLEPYTPSWTSLKGVGESKLISQTSYLSILLVPVIASIWPKIRPILGSNFTEFEKLPLTLALAFFSALSVIVAQIIFQIFAPTLLKSYNYHDFVNYRLQQFSQSPTATQLKAYISSLRREAKKIKSTKEVIEYNNNLINLVEERFEILTTSTTLDIGRDKETLADLYRSVASLDYRIPNRVNYLARLFCAFFYLMSIIIILRAFSIQVCVVSREAQFLQMWGC